MHLLTFMRIARPSGYARTKYATAMSITDSPTSFPKRRRRYVRRRTELVKAGGENSRFRFDHPTEEQ